MNQLRDKAVRRSVSRYADSHRMRGTGRASGRTTGSGGTEWTGCQPCRRHLARRRCAA